MLMFIKLTADNLEELGGRYNLRKTPFGENVIGWTLIVRKCACRLTQHFYDVSNNEMFNEKYVALDKTEGDYRECILRSDYLNCGHDTEKDVMCEEAVEEPVAEPAEVQPQLLFEYTFEARLSYGRPMSPLDQVFTVRMKDKSLEQAKDKARLALGETPSQTYWAFRLITVMEVSNRGYA